MPAESASRRRLWPGLLLSFGLAAALLLLAYALLGVYPFGSHMLSKYDLSDQFIPQYCHFWDVLHGKASLFFSWDTALGINMAGVAGRSAFLSPVNLLFFLAVPRDFILPSMSFFLIIKLGLTCVTCHLFLDRVFSLSLFWRTALSLLYGFSGYTYQYYAHIHWLDTMILLPLVALGLWTLCRGGRVWLYLGSLTLCLVQDIYLSYMLYLALLLCGGLFILLVRPGRDRVPAVWRFGWSSVAALLLSAPVSLPAVLNISSSSRFAGGPNISAILQTGIETYPEKTGMLVGSALLVTLLFIFLTRLFRRERRMGVFLLVSVLLLALPILFENIDLIWHMGSYMMFPMRFGFLLTFVLVLAGAYTLRRGGLRLIRPSAALPLLLGASAAVLTCVVLLWFQCDTKEGLFPIPPGWKYGLLFALLVSVYYLALRVGRRRASLVLVGLLLLTETAVYSAGTFSESLYPNFEEKGSHLIANAVEARKGLELDGNTRVERVKDMGAQLGTNYDLSMGVPGLSNWTHLIEPALQTAMNRLGYTTVYTRICNPGGTAFTDGLLHIGQTMSLQPLDGPLYTDTGREAQGLRLYENAFHPPFGLLAPASFAEKTALTNDWVENQNRLYALLSGEEAPLLTIPEAENRDGSLTFQVSGSQYLYYKGSSSWLRVNGEAIAVPSADRPVNTVYPAMLNNNVLYLGYFENETVTVEGEYLRALDLSLLDARRLLALGDKLEAENTGVSVTAGNASLTVTIADAAQEQCLFLPVAALDGWSCTVNGKKAAAGKAADILMAIPLEAGDNVVELRFTAPGLLPGWLAAGGTALVLLASVLLRRRLGWLVRGDGLVEFGSRIALITAVAALLLLLYAVPVAVGLYRYFIG